MSVESFLQLWTRNNALIIEAIIALILVSVVYLAFRTFFGKEEEPVAKAAALDMGEVEKTLQKILENQAPGAPTSAPATSEESAALVAEVTKLKTDLAEKEKVVEEMKKAQVLASAPGGADPAELEMKVKDLEARLAEYEIISEDIADLSFYKEENSKLQKELDELKAGAPAVAAEPAPPSETPPTVEEILESNPTELAAAEVAALPPDAADLVKDVMSESPAAVETPTTEPDDSQLMNQFENFVKKG